jgi:hypothetical protein
MSRKRRKEIRVGADFLVRAIESPPGGHLLHQQLPLARQSSTTQTRWLEPFGIHTTIVNPGFFRPELLTEQSTNDAEPSIANYRSTEVRWSSNGNRRTGANPAKLARALVTIASRDPPPRGFIAGQMPLRVGTEQKLADLKAQVEANRDLSTSLAFG